MCLEKKNQTKTQCKLCTQAAGSEKNSKVGCSLRTGLVNYGKEVLIRAVQDSPLLVVELNLVVVSVVKLKIPTQKYS